MMNSRTLAAMGIRRQRATIWDMSGSRLPLRGLCYSGVLRAAMTITPRPGLTRTWVARPSQYSRFAAPSASQAADTKCLSLAEHRDVGLTYDVRVQRRLDDLLRLVGIAQGAQFLWVTLGGGIVVAGLVGGVLALAFTLPWWSIVLMVVGIFVLTTGAVGWLVERARPEPAASPLTEVIDRGMRLRDRLSADSEVGTPEHVAGWTVRTRDWMTDAEEVVGQIAPLRLPAFRLDLLIANYPPSDVPSWKADLLVDMDIRIDRLLVLRASL